ncbi:SAM-dependent methyltransferase [Amycolatopsis jejuensis]|uniref:SAM-dependent methyltransferase n=1 Tax=Amycolatopsis jejuensis TaxID=330084 RepID=UPI00068ADE57|nr:SAM-dependent methyltransferase [Amycolatopsis jejuensis]
MSVGAVATEPRWSHDRPSSARLTDALLGGHDHYACDRDLVRRLLDVTPDAAVPAREQRQWLVRTIRHLAAQCGIDQFLDLGSGLPAPENTHQVAQRYRPGARVVYVDHDPVVQVHGRAVLEENEHTHVSGADLADPGATFGDPVVYRHLDFERPVAVLLCGVLHQVASADEARYIVRSYVSELAPGSYLLLTHDHVPGDAASGDLVRRLGAVLGREGLDTVHRERGEIESFFAGLELVEPGVVPLHEWWPEGPRFAPLSKMHFLRLGGVGRKP